MVKYRLDVSNVNGDSEFGRFLASQGITENLDYWNRGVLELNEKQAQALEKRINEWNDDCPNAPVFFSPATGTEHVVSVQIRGFHHRDSFQW